MLSRANAFSISVDVDSNTSIACRLASSELSSRASVVAARAAASIASFPRALASKSKSAHTPHFPSSSATHHSAPSRPYGTHSFTKTPSASSSGHLHDLPSAVHVVARAPSIASDAETTSAARAIVRARLFARAIVASSRASRRAVRE
jgi:hypothetical protein